jgi:hypothetical protein
MPLGATDISMIQVAASGGLSSNNIDLETIYKLYVNGDATGDFGLDDMANKDYPTVATNAASSVTSNSMTCNGTISSDGNVLGDITQRGFYFGTNSNYASNTKVNAGGTAIAAYTLSRTSLSGGTTYYITAYAINALGERQGSTVSQATSVSLQSFTYVMPADGPSNNPEFVCGLTTSGEDTNGVSNTGYHDGAAVSGFPIINDNVYSDSGGTTSLANGYYRMASGTKGANQTFQIISGVVNAIDNC